ncbi:hypothetical protein [Methanobrevibacter sp.]|uniref:hypothetical protein n=1 Tax=Methanobrevibacter sp. TaxID=66852 RepID=UPI00260127F4|nr:hypothetical protein [Methanobrevibacter sp.]
MSWPLLKLAKLKIRRVEESKVVARDGGNIAGNALRELEERTGRKVVISKNSKNPRLLDENLK